MGLSICTVQRGNDITLYVELIDTQKDTVLWKDGYNRSMTNLVALQSEIAKDVSTKLKTKLTGSEEARVTKTSTTNPEAYQHYLKGRYYWNRRTAENIRKAIEQFKGAIDNDPNYALAYAGLADCYAVLSEYAGTPISETALQAKSFAERAIAIDGQLTEPHASLGGSIEQCGNGRKLKRNSNVRLISIQITRRRITGILFTLKIWGNLMTQAALIKRAQEIDPLSSVININATERA